MFTDPRRKDSRASLEAALQHPNMQAFLWMLRYGEGTQGSEGYKTLFGGELFSSMADHPNIRVKRKLRNGGTLESTAAGAYQHLARTWDANQLLYGFADFSPHNQDLSAVALITGRGALTDVLAGRLEEAIMKCNREWASLPGSPYGQPTVTLADCRREFAEGLGMTETALGTTLAAARVAAPQPTPKMVPALEQRSATIAEKLSTPVPPVAVWVAPPPAPQTAPESFQQTMLAAPSGVGGGEQLSSNKGKFMDNATLQALLSAVRSVLIAIGATLVARGYMTDATVNSVVGALLVLGPLLWGLVQKFQAERSAKEREAVAVNTGIIVADATVGQTPPVAMMQATKLIENIGSRVQLADDPRIVPVITPAADGTTARKTS